MPRGIYKRIKKRTWKLSNETRKKISESHKGINTWMKDRKLTEEHKKNIGLGNKGKPKPPYPRYFGESISKKLLGNKNTLGKHWKVSEMGRKNISEAMKKIVLNGNHNFWKGGITNINYKIRHSLEYKLWREAVFRRDNWTCIWCGFKGYVEADHIKPFSLFPALRFAIDNGRTLCKDCHKKTDTYGEKVKKLEVEKLKDNLNK